MSDPTIQVLLYMLATLALGVVLGWLVWRFGQGQKMSAEVDFWRNHLEQTRMERQNDLNKIDALTREKADLKKRLAAMR